MGILPKKHRPGNGADDYSCLRTMKNLEIANVAASYDQNVIVILRIGSTGYPGWVKRAFMAKFSIQPGRMV
jgi:hypothetical protein